MLLNSSSWHKSMQDIRSPASSWRLTRSHCVKGSFIEAASWKLKIGIGCRLFFNAWYTIISLIELLFCSTSCSTWLNSCRSYFCTRNLIYQFFLSINQWNKLRKQIHFTVITSPILYCIQIFRNTCHLRWTSHQPSLSTSSSNRPHSFEGKRVIH